MHALEVGPRKAILHALEEGPRKAVLLSLTCPFQSLKTLTLTGLCTHMQTLTETRGWVAIRGELLAYLPGKSLLGIRLTAGGWVTVYAAVTATRMHIFANPDAVRRPARGRMSCRVPSRPVLKCPGWWW